MKFAIISDAHLFQSFIKNYDPLGDFRKVLQEIKEDKPDALLIAGDMFDCKKTPGAYLRHYEGEGLMMKVRDVLMDFGIPTYALRGNHEKEEVLKGLAQTVENFHYIRNDWIKLGDVHIFFMDTHFEGDLYEPNAVSEIIGKLSSPKSEDKKALITHETFEPFPNSLPKEVIKEAAKSFDWILNGHMHMWNPSAYDINNVITLPSLLPSRLRLGKYWSEQYYLDNNGKTKSEKKDSPFGYVILDAENDTIELHKFEPSKKIVEISIDVTGLSLKGTLDCFREVLDKLKEKKDNDSCIILPEIHGVSNFVASYVGEVFKEYSELNVEDLRNNSEPRITTASGEIVPAPQFDPEQLFEEIAQDFHAIRDALSEDVRIDLSVEDLGKILHEIREGGLLEKLPPRVTTRLESLLCEIFACFQSVDKPESFDSDVKNIIKRVKE